MRVVCVAGAGANCTKVEAAMDALEEWGAQVILVHTGQHYDPATSDVFFAELDIRCPDHFLSCRPQICPVSFITRRAAGNPSLDVTRKGTSVTVKELIRPIPGVRHFSLLRQRIAFRGSALYWERNYARGGTSGPGSYDAAGEAKADFLNDFVRTREVSSVIEFGCGDGNQLSLADYPLYIGLDVSRSAIELCQRRFAGDYTKSFFLYDGTCFTDRVGLFAADLGLSLDVIYHLTEEAVFDAYLTHLFAAGTRFVIIYATNREISGTAPHVRHRHFTRWTEEHALGWRLVEVTPGPNKGPDRADFFTFEKAAHTRVAG